MAAGHWELTLSGIPKSLSKTDLVVPKEIVHLWLQAAHEWPAMPLLVREYAFYNMIQTQQKRALQLMGILSMGWFFYALDGSVINVLITNENFIKTFKITPNRLGLFGLFPAVGALISVLGVGGLLNRVFGRKRTFQIATVLVMSGVVLQTFTNNWRDANGLVLGYYVTEIAPKAVRGRMLILVQQFSSSLIAIAGSWIGFGLTYLPQDKSYSWKVANSLQFLPGVIFFCLTFLLPESPRWLARQYPEDDGPVIAALCSIRNMPAQSSEIVSEAKEIRDYDTWHVVHGSVSVTNVFTQKPLAKRVFNAFIPLLATQLSGVGTINTYAAIIYERLGLETQRNSLLLTSCLQILYTASALGSSYVVEKLGRRRCIVWGSLANAIGVAAITGLSIGFEGEPNKIANGWIVAFIALVTSNYWLFSTGPITVYVNEILPSQAREIGVGVANVVPIAVAIALGQKWPTATADLGAKSYIILLVTSVVAFLLNWWFIVEPKGLSIERVDQEIREEKAADKAATEMVEDVRVQTSVSGVPEIE